MKAEFYKHLPHQHNPINLSSLNNTAACNVQTQRLTEVNKKKMKKCKEIEECDP